MNHQLKDHFLLHAIVLVWGYTGIIGRWSTLAPDQLVLLRMLAAFIALAVVLHGRLMKIPLNSAVTFLAVGFIVAAHWVTFFAAIDASNVSVALACMASTSVFAAFIEPLLYRRRIAPEEVIFSIVAMLGVVVIFGVTDGYHKGIILALVSSFLAALFAVINGKLYHLNKSTWAPDGGSSLMTAYEMLGGCLAIGIYQIGWGDPINTWNLTSHNILLAIVLGVVCTALPFVGSLYVMRSISPFTACLTVNMEPVYAIILALIHFGESEKMRPEFYGAALVIILSVAGNALYKRYRTKPLNPVSHEQT